MVELIGKKCQGGGLNLRMAKDVGMLKDAMMNTLA